MTRFYHKLLLLFAGMSLAASPGAFADGVTVGDFNFVLNKTAKTATLTFQSLLMAKNTYSVRNHKIF